jgi:hypothetical protein
MNAFACILRAGLLPFSKRAGAVPTLLLLLGSLAPASVRAQEACLKGCGYPGYPGMVFTLGDGFVAKGGEVKVTHMGFLGQVYNNDGITPRKVGVPNYIGELSVIDPVTGEDKFLFRNQKDWITHENDSGTVISLGIYPKGAPVVFRYVNVDGKETSYKTFNRYSGDNVAGTYDFNADPVLKNLAINGKPKPVSGGSWNWEGLNHNLWAVAASVPGTDQKQFHFEDADDRIFNDIVFRVSGVALVSETFRLQVPAISGTANPDGSHRVSIANAADAVSKDSRLFYTTDGSVPEVDSLGAPKGATREYLSPIAVTATSTITAIAWKKTVDNGGNVTRFTPSGPVSQTFTVPRLQWSKPTATPPGGDSKGTVSVTLAQAEGARIHYRLCDPGSVCDAPTAANPAYTGAPIVLTEGKTIKAIAIQSPRDNSEVAVFTFTVTRLQWSMPTATPPGGRTTGTVNVTLAQAEGAAIHYRLCDAGAVCDAPTSADAAYAGAPLVVTGGKVLKAIAVGAGRDNSAVAVFTFSLAYTVADAVYLDRNGDGRIDAARITLNGPAPALPAGISLEDPFNPGKRKAVAAPGLRWDSALPSVLWAEFPESPFLAGTGFAPRTYGAFDKGGEGYPTEAFTIRDGAGPVIVSAESEISLDSAGAHRLLVTFSERLGSATGAFPFVIKRGGASIESGMEISGMEQLSDKSYRYTFRSPIFPVPGDSIKATPLAVDGLGNASGMNAFLEIGGKRPSVSARIEVTGGGCVKGGPVPNAKALEIPVSVVLPSATAPASGSCGEIRETPVCLDCLTPDWKAADPARPDAAGIPAGPEIKVTTRWPFTFDLAYFNTLGEFVNHARGEVTARMLESVKADASGEKTVALRWYPVSADGNQAATGAYVVKGSVATKAGVDRETLPGVPVQVASTTQKVLVRFGYLR